MAESLSPVEPIAVNATRTIEHESSCSREGNFENGLVNLFIKCGSVYIDETIFNKCVVDIKNLIDLSSLGNHLLTHRLIPKREQLNDILNPHHSAPDKLNHLLSHVSKAGKHGYLLLYVSLYESALKDGHQGHKEAVEELKKTAREMVQPIPADILQAVKELKLMEERANKETSECESSGDSISKGQHNESGYESNVQPEMAVKSRPEMHSDGSLTFECDCSDGCTIDKYERHKERPKSKKFPKLNVQGVSYEASILEHKLAKETKAIKVAFAELRENTFRKLSKSCRLRDVLQHVKRLIDIRDCNVKTYEDLEDMLCPCYCSWFNYDILKQIRRKFLYSTGKFDKALHKYDELFFSYCNRRCFESEGTFHPKPSSDSMTSLVFKIDKRFDDYLLTDVLKIRNTVIDVINCPEYAVYVMSVQEGCVEVSCCILSWAAVSHLNQNQISRLRECDIISFKVEDIDLMEFQATDGDYQISQIRGNDISSYKFEDEELMEESSDDQCFDSSTDSEGYDASSEGEVDDLLSDISLQVASILSSKPKRKDIDIYSELHEKWYMLGTELEIDDEELDELREKYSDDPRMRTVKMFGVWLEKVENPTYRKLLKALMNIGKRDVAESICTEIGLTSSLDNILKIATQFKISDCSPISISRMKEIDTKPSEPVTDQTSTVIVGDTSDSTFLPHDQVLRDNFTQTSAHVQPSRFIGKSTSIPSSSETFSNELNRSKIHTLPSDMSTQDDQIHEPIASAFVDTRTEPQSETAYKTMIHNHDTLVTALSTDIMTISGAMLAKEFIPAEISSKMLLPNFTPQEKATILVNTVTDKIKIAPKRFNELINIFSEQTCTKDIVPSLSSLSSFETSIKDSKHDIGVIVSTDQLYVVCENHMYPAWTSLDPDDKIDLEARLLTDAETIGQDFALLCYKMRDSFEQRGITPQVLAYVLLDLTVYKPSSNSSIPLLKEKEEVLMKVQSVHGTFNALRPHMSFYNYEILQFLIEGKGSETDKAAQFTEFCKHHVFEVPQLFKYSKGHQEMKQRLHVKVTENFKAAFLLKSTDEALPPPIGDAKNVCSSKLGISLEDAKIIQRKIAKILKLNPSSLFLDTISEGSVILTFLLPTCVSLAGLDDNPEIIQLSSNGISILCGPPGQLKLIDLTPSGMIMRWSQPEYIYGCKSLTQYTVYYRKKDEHEWQTFELDSLNTHILVPNLNDGDIYVFKVCTVSDVGTLQYSDESDPIVISADEILTNNIHKVIVANKDILISAFSSAASNTIAAVLSIKGVISKEDESQISLASTPSQKATILVIAVEYQIQKSPKKFQDFLHVIHALSDDTVENLRSYYHKKDMLTLAISSADPDKIAAMLSRILKRIISKEGAAQIYWTSTPSEKRELVSAAIMKASPQEFQNFLNAIRKVNLSLPSDFVVTIQSCRYERGKLISTFSSADLNTITTMLLIKGIISKEAKTQINLTSTPSEKAILLLTTIENQAPKRFFWNLSLPGDVVNSLWSDYYDNSVYKQYLDYLYASLENKQRPSDQWPPSTTKIFFRLAMIRSATVRRGYIKNHFVQMTITGKVDNILRQKYPIQLKDIFKETERQIKVTKEDVNQRKVVLLEGALGCGDSTLSVYICQNWEKSQLFSQFKLVIFVRLRDPEVKNAEDLADLLPCSNAKTAQLLAGVMMEMKCQDVLFILDGWDELPSNLRKRSIFVDLIGPYLSSSNPLSKSTVIVTSRPIASGDLHQVVSSRVEILGFTAEERHQFFTECLKGDTEAVKSLLERIEENPEVAGSCYLPLNATILVHLFKSDRSTLPTTLYGIFSSLVLYCIKRHLKLRTQYKDVSIESLDQLPEFVKKPFSVLCKLAYDGVMEDKIIFTSLPSDVNTLSLLQGVGSFIGREKAVSHNFLHLSIQELLAAWYIAAQLPASEQVSKFNELFDKSRFSAIFRFYAAITKLKTPGIKEVVIRIAKAESKSLLLSLLHCLYEAQDPSLCESVAQQLQHRLNLYCTTLTPSDCLCIGYFLAHVCKMVADEFEVNLVSCSIGDQGCKYLIIGLHKYIYIDTHSVVTTLLHMTMDSNAISRHGLHHLSTLLKIGCVNYLSLNYNNLSERDTAHAIFGIFAEQLKNNSTLRTLWLSGCGLNTQCAECLAEALTTNNHLKQLCIPNNALCDDGIQHLAHALRVNHGLQNLYLVSCGMTDEGLECLTKSLQQNNALNQLWVWNNSSIQNRLTEKIVPVLTEYLQHNHTLTWLQLPKNLESYTASIEKAVNDVRERRGLLLIKVIVLDL